MPSRAAGEESTFHDFSNANITISGTNYKPTDFKNFRVDDLGINGTVSFGYTRRFDIPGKPGQSAMIDVRVKTRIVMSVLDRKDVYKKIENPGLAALEIKPVPGVKIGKLDKSAHRLTGKVKGRFDSIRDDLIGAAFTVVPWKGTRSFRIRVVKPGYLYVMKANDKFLKEESRYEWEPQPDAITGPYIKGIYRTLAQEGWFLSFRGYELAVVAGKIEIKDK
jgi:hypothetical protein